MCGFFAGRKSTNAQQWRKQPRPDYGTQGIFINILHSCGNDGISGLIFVLPPYYFYQYCFFPPKHFYADECHLSRFFSPAFWTTPIACSRSTMSSPKTRPILGDPAAFVVRLEPCDSHRQLHEPHLMGAAVQPLLSFALPPNRQHAVLSRVFGFLKTALRKGSSAFLFH